MLPDERSSIQFDGTLRRRNVPERSVGSEVIVARPRDGEAVTMSSAAAVVWTHLAEWSSPLAVDRALAAAFPDVADTDRIVARTEILQMLEHDDLVERG